MRNAIVVARFELTQFFREPQFFISFFIVPLMVIGLYVFFILYSGMTESESEFISQMLTILVGVLVTGMSLTMCADSFAGERERNTLEILLSSPVGLRTLFWGKVLSVLPLTILTGWTGQGIVTGISISSGLVSWSMVQLILVFMLTPVSAFFIASISIFISLKTGTVRSAAQISGLFVLLYLFAMQALSQVFFLYPLAALCVMMVMTAAGLLVIYKSMRKFNDIIYTMK